MLRRRVFRALSILGGIALGVWLSLPAEVTAGKGDTWTSIAARYGVAVRALRAANPGMASPKPGEAVRLPIPRWRFHLRAWGVERAVAQILATPTPARTARKAAAPASGRRDRASPEDLRAALEEINRFRAAEGRLPLVWDEGLAALARARAEDMIARRYYSHNDPSTGRPALEGKLPVWGEVLVKSWGYSMPPPRLDPVAAWRSSEPHWTILTDGSYSRIGLGIACGRWDQMTVCIAVGIVTP
ncbi:MAG: CAP domain-containing protein [Armatimonadota bacterium]|nr:CAP domain-containing protein [Armatimonadota bacterium]